MTKKAAEFKHDKSNYYEPSVKDIVWVFWLDKEIWPAIVKSELAETKSDRKRYLCQFFDKR